MLCWNGQSVHAREVAGVYGVRQHAHMFAVDMLRCVCVCGGDDARLTICCEHAILQKEILSVQPAGTARGHGAAGGSGAAAGAAGGQGGSSRAHKGGEGGGAGDGGGTGAGSSESAVVGGKRKAVYALLLSPPANEQTGAAAGAEAAGACHKRPRFDADEIVKHVGALYRWEWCAEDGTYVSFDPKLCIEIEKCFRHDLWGARVWGKGFPVGPDEELKCVIDFSDMTASIVGTEWVSAVRRWDIHNPMAEGWSHQVANVSIVDVQPGWCDYKVVESAFFDRARSDNMPPRISRHTHTIVKVRRVQNRKLFRQFEAERKSLEEQRGKDKVELTREYAWHGSGKRKPDDIAAGKGFMMQVLPAPTLPQSPTPLLSLPPFLSPSLCMARY